MSEKKLSDLPYDQLIEKVREIRQGRVMPAKKKRVVKKSTARVRKNRASALIDNMTPEQRELLLKKLGAKDDS